jgi:hypothetical protein
MKERFPFMLMGLLGPASLFSSLEKYALIYQTADLFNQA